MRITDRVLAIALAIVPCAVASSVLLAPAASAESAPSELDRANARKLFNEGLDLRNAGDPQGALAKFEAADAIYPTPRGRLEVGRQRMLLGRLVEGYTALLSVANVKVAPKDEPKYAPHRAEAAKLAQELEARIPTLRFVLSGVPSDANPRVRVDDALVPAAALGEPRMVNPGKHVVVLSVDGRPDVTSEIALKEGEARTVTLTLPPEEPAVATPAAPAQVAPLPAPKSFPSTRRDHAPEKAEGAGDGQRTLALVAGGAGLVALGVGSWLGLSARSTASDADRYCNGTACTDPRGVDLKKDAIRQADLATIGFVAGAALLGGAAVLWLTAPTKDDKQVARAGVVIGVGSLGLAGSF